MYAAFIGSRDFSHDLLNDIQFNRAPVFCHGTEAADSLFAGNLKVELQPAQPSARSWSSRFSVQLEQGDQVHSSICESDPTSANGFVRSGS
jgi:hypothetical protein